ncbi:MAG TPA: NAD(+) synthase [Gaiellaceae bacterium]
MNAGPAGRIAQIAPDVLDIDPEQVEAEIVNRLRAIVGHELRRRGAVIGVSGGIDSSVTAALATRAFGADRTVGVLMPEADSDDDTLELSGLVTSALGIESVVEDITPILRASGCYERRDEAVRAVVPQFGEGWKFKIVLPTVLATDNYRLFSLVAESPTGEHVEARLPAAQYLTIVAATNFKQRTRKMLEYFHADRLNYAVIGTPNRLEYDQGFFVKVGDGAADVKPIAHLYKTQVVQLAEYLEIPKRILSRAPTTDTYSLAQTQEEFYFSLPYPQMDLCLYARNHELPPEAVADAVALSREDVQRVYDDIDQKRRTTRYLHLPPQLVAPVPEIEH